MYLSSPLSSSLSFFLALSLTFFLELKALLFGLHREKRSINTYIEYNTIRLSICI